MLALVFKLLIRSYWLVIPTNIRGRCLFKESCSRHVYRLLNEQGFKSGWKAFKTRYHSCRAPYAVITTEKGVRQLHLCTGEIVDEHDVSSVILREEQGDASNG